MKNLYNKGWLPKMNKKNKIYEGARYKFVIKKEIGSGGNGKVYDVDIIGHPKLDFVAKFFSADKRNLKKCNKRFERFKKEIEYVNKLTDIEGIMLIEDCNLSSMDNSWYLMKKAREYKVNTRKKLNEKLDDIMKIALVIKQLHSRDMEHRDIEPDNILILNNRVYLTDFGLLFCDNDIDNLTDLNERIGPGKIAPPEFSNLGAFSYIDFKASDVYLFAKVIWMILKEEPFGFYGPYKYGEDSKQLLLDEKKYSVETFIPINKLIHEATYDDFTKRINIDDCIGYIELQQKLISNNLNDDEKVIINNLKNDSYKEYEHIIFDMSPSSDEYTESMIETFKSLDESMEFIHYIIVTDDSAHMKATEEYLKDLTNGSIRHMQNEKIVVVFNQTYPDSLFPNGENSNDFYKKKNRDF